MDPLESSQCIRPLKQTCPRRRCVLGECFEQHRPRLRRLIAVRIDGRLRNRLDASDVIQEAFVRMANQTTASPDAKNFWPPYLWLRRITLWTLAELQRKHLGAQSRDVRREVSLDFPMCLDSLELAERLLDSITSPTQAVQRKEKVLQVRKALKQLEPVDCEILVLRHVERLSRSETAELLGLSAGTAAKRYFRALKRCRLLLSQQGCDDA